MRYELAIFLYETVAQACRFKSGAIEWTVPRRDRAEDAIEKKKSNSKICVHAAVVVHRVVMNVMQAARRAKPKTQNGSALHPEVRQMHTVVQITEHEERPGYQGRECNHLV